MQAQLGWPKGPRWFRHVSIFGMTALMDVNFVTSRQPQRWLTKLICEVAYRTTQQVLV